MADTVRVRFEGDSSDLVQAMERAGDESKEMARQIDRSSRDGGAAFDSLSEGVDGAESKFTGLSDSIEGTGDIMEGFRTGNVAQMAMGFADLASGMVSLVIPAVKSMALTLKANLAPAMSAISAHPLMAAILIGGAIIVGLILLEEKFGLVSGAIDWVKDSLTDLWNYARPVLKAMKEAVEDVLDPIQNLKDTASGKNGGWLGGGGLFGGFFSHTGGRVPGPSGMDVPMILQAGETVIPRGSSQGTGGGVTVVVQGSVITDRDLGRVVADALRNNRMIGVTI